MNPTVIRNTMILVIVFLSSGCAGRYFQPVGVVAVPVRHTLAAWPCHEHWNGVILNGEKVGFTHLKLEPIGQAGLFQVESQAVLHFTFLGRGKEIALQGSEQLAADLTLQRFHYRQTIDGVVLEQRGRMVGGVVEVELRSGEAVTTARHVATEPVYSSNALVLYPPLHGLEVRRHYRYLIYDGETRRLATDIAGSEGAPAGQIRLMLEWIGHNLRQENTDVFSALDVLERGAAECQGHSYLYAALARSLGIPTRVNGLVYSDLGHGFLYHTWAESWLDGHWQPVDPTFGQLRADATHLRLVEGEGPGELAALVPLIGRLQVRLLAID